MKQTLEKFVSSLSSSNCLPPLAFALCNELMHSYKDCNLELLLLVCELCCRTDAGDVCLRLCLSDENLKAREDILFDLKERFTDDEALNETQTLGQNRCSWAFLYKKYGSSFEKFKDEALQKALSCSAVGTAGSHLPTPLLFDKGRLYFKRYYNYEAGCAALIKEHEKNQPFLKDQEDLLFAKKMLELLFEKFKQTFPDELDKQKCAAALALQSGFTVISGGPGTGKTTTVTNLLLTMLAVKLRRNKTENVRIMLCAPTGKASGRVGESITQKLDEMLKAGKSDARLDALLKDAGIESLKTLLERIPRSAQTVHSLIGVHPHSTLTKFNESNPLPCDILVADEVSMIDMPLFYKLCKALPKDAVLILLGDKDQLCSVEAGSVMADLCQLRMPSNERVKETAFLAECLEKSLKDPEQMSDHVMFLTKSFRFKEDSGIGKLARAVNSAVLNYQEDEALLYLQKTVDSLQSFSDVIFRNYDASNERKVMRNLVEDSMGKGYGAFFDYVEQHPYLDEETAGFAFKLLDSYRLLCSNRSGIFGVKNLNREIVKEIIKNKKISAKDLWFKGRVVMATVNSNSIGIHNGDVGFAAFDKSGELKVWFPDPDEKGKAKAINPVYLGDCEDAYAMTIHKSQGSEYEKAVVVLSNQQDNRVLCRELIYTGITRAKKTLEICAELQILLRSCLKSVQRESALALRLLS